MSKKSDVPDNVVHLEPEAKKGRRKKLIHEEAIRANFIDVLNRDKDCPWPRFRQLFKVLIDPHGVRTHVRVGRGQVCRHVSMEALIAELCWYSKYKLPQVNATGELVLSTADATELARQWTCYKKGFQIKKVAPVREKSEPGLCWQRLPFNLTPGDTPTFDELFSKATNVRPILQWIGSLFDADSPRQQYVYLWGDGLDGKGSLLYFLKEIFGPAYKAEIPSTNQFWTHGLLGKRIIALDDLSKPDMKFLTSGIFKGLTGGGALRTEEKGGATIDGDFICKLIITSNHKPQIESSKADKRRIIYSEFAPRDVAPSEDFKKKLLKEGPAFLWKCREAYQSLRRGEWIPSDGEKLETILSDHDEFFEVHLQRHFKPVEESQEEHTSAGAMRVIMRNEAEIRDDREYRRFTDFLKRRHGIEKKRLVRNGSWSYSGIAIRDKTKENNKSDLENC